jgi:hypothetical protein
MTQREDQLLVNIKQQLNRCASFGGGKLAADFKQAWDYYFQRPRGDEVPDAGASAVVSGDLSAMTEATLSQMLSAFSTDSLVEFEAEDAGDEDQAKLEAETVTRLVMGQRDSGFIQFLQSTKEAILLRNGMMKVYVEETITRSTREYEGVTSEALGEFILGTGAHDWTILDYSPESKKLRIRLEFKKQELRTTSLPIANFHYIEDWHTLDLQDIPFCAERHVEARSELIRRGFPKAKVQSLKPFTTDTEIATNAQSLGSTHETPIPMDESQELIEWFECYILQDLDGDGISERYRVAVGGESLDVLLEEIPVELVPYAAGAAIINPHRFLSISLFDKLRQNQDINTGLERALMDNANAVNRPKLGYLDGMVNVEDIESGRVTGGIRVRQAAGDVKRAIAPIVVPDMTQGILANLQHQRSLRSEMGGASLDLATGQMQLNERLGSEGLDRAYSVMEQLAAFMTRTLAQTLVRNTFLLAHATLRRMYQAPITLKRHGRWEVTNPTQWRERQHLLVKVGMSPNERSRRAGVLSNILQSQIALADKGMDEVLVDINNFYQCLMDWARANDLPNPERYFIDPRSDESMQALAQKQQAEQAEQEAQRAFMKQAVELEQLRTAFDKYRQDTDLQFKYWEATLKAETEEARIVGQVTGDLVKDRQGERRELRTAGRGTGE